MGDETRPHLMEEETHAVRAIYEHLLTVPIEWQAGYPPHEPHSQHKYNGGCAVCRTDQPAAMRNVAAAALDALRSLPVEERMAAMGMERSGWSGHRRGVWNELGRVHDKNSVHMDGCIPLYIESAPLPAGREKK